MRTSENCSYANFVELRQFELRRIPIPRTSVNKGERKEVLTVADETLALEVNLPPLPCLNSPRPCPQHHPDLTVRCSRSADSSVIHPRLVPW